ncbi:MAG: toxin-antitoxin system HicB family antitoxin [Candidatus Aminicenantaceae bacterium]
MNDRDESPPEPLTCRKFSGKFMVRITPELHRNLTIEAREQGISLNRLINTKLHR